MYNLTKLTRKYSELTFELYDFELREVYGNISLKLHYRAVLYSQYWIHT